jgi:replication factor C subunit 2/4
MSKQTRQPITLPWIEKYRPNKLEDIILEDNVRMIFSQMMKNDNISNLIITGPPGTGKTTSIICLAKQLLGAYYNEGAIELNASDNRGLDIITSKIIPFCKKKLVNSSDPTKKIYKIIILDEADNLTKKAQNTLSNLIEEHFNNTRFAFTCNDSSQIIEAIQSRCYIIHLKHIPSINLLSRLKTICNKEEIEYDDNGLNTIIYVSQGDIRQAISMLEITHDSLNKITEENVYKVHDRPSIERIKEVIDYCSNCQLSKAIERMNFIRKKGYNNNDIVLAVISTLKNIEMDEDLRIHFISISNDTYIIVSNGVDSNLQVDACLSRMCKFVLTKKNVK